MRVVENSVHFYKLPYWREVRWFNSVEDGGTFALLRIVGDDGSTGIAEAAIKPTWSGVSPRSVAAVLEDLLLPALREIDVGDADAVGRMLARFPENRLTKMLVDNACCTLRSATARQPIWRLMGGVQEIDISWCVTRQPPERMCREAVEKIGQHGFRALKIKGGQGVATDLEAITKIRAAVGDGIAFYVDANGAYGREEAPDYVRVIADAGALVAEDPCPLQPDETFARLQAGSPIPILVDSPCTTLRDAEQFLRHGARTLSVKPGRVGMTEAGRITKAAVAGGANVCSGMSAESAVGTLISLQSAAALKQPLASAEQSFFLMMREQIMHEPLTIDDGRVRLPATADYGELVDWEKLQRLAL